MTAFIQSDRRKSRHSFSLLEMLLVIVVVAVVGVVSFEGYSASMQAMAVTTGADAIRDVLTEGREDAVAQNTSVEVRIYDLPTPSGGDPVYDELQLHWLRADRTTSAVANPVFLPAWAAIDATPAHSPLIALNSEVATPDANDPRLSADTRAFHFLPDGSTDLNPATNWFLTVRPANQSDPAHFPSNWACISVDATTGRTQIYRP